ncbi:sulfotransferase [Thermosynechococcaceae cyanobacterium Okahandja]
MNKLTHPNFIIGGSAASGTSFLSSILAQHPEVYLPQKMRPEPHYFYKSWEYQKGISYYLSQWFNNIPRDIIAAGEKSSSYLFGGEKVAKRIFDAYPDMKFVFILRNPIERTWANYRYTVLQGLEDLSFEDALKDEPKRILEQRGIWAEIQPYNYTGRGFYASQIKDYLKFFPEDNILLIKFEAFVSQTNAELQKLCKFLNLTIFDFDYAIPPNYTNFSIIDPRIQKKLRQYFGNRFDKVIEAIRRKEPLEKFADSYESERMLKLLVNNIKDNKEPIPIAARSYLNDLFARDIAQLKHFVDFDLSDWK